MRAGSSSNNLNMAADLQKTKVLIENQQIGIYFGAVILAISIALLTPATTALAAGINWALAFMLFVTFLQVPIIDLGQSFTQFRFLTALLITNFIVLPLFVILLIQLLPADPVLQFGVLLVLLAPCIDYVITFSYIGRADARLLLAATPALLVAQMLLLPLYLGIFLGEAASRLIHPEPFIHALIWLIVTPLLLAGLVQRWATHFQAGKQVSMALGILPVPATALVLFIVFAAVVPQLGLAIEVVITVIPFYVAFAAIAPLIGWQIGRLFQLNTAAGRAIAFSAGTRNSLVVLPLAFAVPGGFPALPALIVTQTLVELLCELIYVRLIPKLSSRP
jgi:arsenite transporter